MESVCFKIKSAPDFTRCQINNEYSMHYFVGSPIDILQNGIPVSNIPTGFSDFHECFGWQKDDIFEFRPQNSDGVSKLNFSISPMICYFEVCITSFFMDDTQLLFGQYSKLQSFWFDTDPGDCQEEHMITPFLKIKNGEVIESQCKSNTDATVASTSEDNVSDVDDSSFPEDIYKCTDEWIKYENRKIAQTGDKHNHHFSSLQEAKTKCMELFIDDCISIDENRENEESIFWSLKRFSKLTNNRDNSEHTSYIRPICRSDG